MNQRLTHHILPNDFIKGTVPETSLVYYVTNKSSEKNKVQFNQNLLCFLLEGQKEVISSNNKLSFQSDNMLLLLSGNTLMTERTTIDNNYKSILLFFSDNFLTDFITKNNSKGLSIDIKVEAVANLFPKDEYIINFEKSLLLLQNKINRNQNLIKIKCEEIFSYLSEKYPSIWNAIITSISNNSNQLQFKQFINQQTDWNLSVDELAFLCNMSTSTFKRKFSEVFNTSPKQYFIQQKMKRALALLQRNKRPSEIFIELGYQNLPAFSNEFKKHFGFSPKEHKIKFELLK